MLKHLETSKGREPLQGPSSEVISVVISEPRQMEPDRSCRDMAIATVTQNQGM